MPPTGLVFEPPPLPAQTPLNILTSNGYVRNDNLTNYAYTQNGTGVVRD